MGAMDEMMEAMLGSMSKEDKQDMMNTMMGKFFADMTAEDKQRMMEQMMPKMMEGINMMEMMPNMMTHMMPHCLNMMLPGIPKEGRIEFVLNMVTTLMEQGSAGMSDEEKNEFVAKILERVTR